MVHYMPEITVFYKNCLEMSSMDKLGFWSNAPKKIQFCSYSYFLYYKLFDITQVTPPTQYSQKDHGVRHVIQKMNNFGERLEVGQKCYSPNPQAVSSKSVDKKWPICFKLAVSKACSNT